jgi:PIN domain nuclease of toxin-antitoxin system
MSVLLDTHVLLWALAEPARLDGETRGTIESGETDVLFSAASIWEIAIKGGLAAAILRSIPPRLLEPRLIPGLPS